MEKLKSAKKQLATLKNYKECFSSPAGRRVLKDMMQRFGFLNTTAVQGDPYTSFYNEGQRAVVVFLCQQIKMDLHQLEEFVNQGDET